MFLEIGFRDLGLIVTGKLANQLAASIEDFESDGTRSGVRQIVVNDCAVGWVLSSGFVGRKRRVRVGITLQTVGGCWRKKMGNFVRRQISCFAQRRDVIKNPERAPVRADDEVVVVNPEIAHGGVRQIQLQGLPVVAVIERDPD